MNRIMGLKNQYLQGPAYFREQQKEHLVRSPAFCFPTLKSSSEFLILMSPGKYSPLNISSLGLVAELKNNSKGLRNKIRQIAFRLARMGTKMSIFAKEYPF